MPYHIPALLNETIQGLNIQPNGIYCDLTFGGGGHSRAILEKLKSSRVPQLQSPIPTTLTDFGTQKQRNLETCGHLYSFDQDLDAFANAIDNEHFHFVHSNFRYLKNFLHYYHIDAVDGILADLGVSFHHFDEAARGFSFRADGPLDMRMNQTATHTAADIVNTYEEADLTRIFTLYGEMKNARQVARRLVLAREKTSVQTTEDLVQIVSPLLRNDKEKKELACVFQALRIEVNDELGALRDMLMAAKDVLKPQGRIAILTYHSLEDRLVKNFFRSGNLDGNIEKDFYGNILSPFRLVNNKVIVPSDEEIARNPRSRSAKLRIAEKI